ncbi:hypothetical protein EMCRGX_G004899 [Ephydatia muelleri]
MTSETRSRTPVTTGCNEADDESGDFTVVLVLCACSNDPHDGGYTHAEQGDNGQRRHGESIATCRLALYLDETAVKAMVEVVAANLGVQVEYKSKHQTEQRADQNHYGDDLFRVLRIFKRIHDLSKPVNGDYQNQNVTHQTNEEYGIAYEEILSLPGNSVAHAQCSVDSSWFSLLSMEQSEYDTLLAFCCDCKYPPECSKNEKDCIRRRAKNFIVKEGLLFYRDKHNKEYRVVTKKEKMKVLDGCHSAELGGGHFGRDKTLLKISERFYWIGMVNDVKEYCKTCANCQKANRKFDKFSAELHPIPVKDEVWHTIGVDLIGPLPETQKGNKYIMTVSCLFSKWPEATALPDKIATGVAEFLFLCFTRHGCCKVKISDQGREFVNQVNDELCRLCGIQCNMTSAYHPQSNGLDERFNQTLQRQLLKFVESEQNSWDQFLDAILFSYRVSCQDSTKHSPFYLVYGRQPRLPIEFTMKCPGASERCDKPEDGLQQTIIGVTSR